MLALVLVLVGIAKKHPIEQKQQAVAVAVTVAVIVSGLVAVLVPVLVFVSVPVFEPAIAMVFGRSSWDGQRAPWHQAPVPLVACLGRAATALWLWWY